MKQTIHPQYFDNAQISCSCGNVFTTGSTKKNINVEVCYKCHPFYTGEHRYLNIKGRIDRFQAKQEAAKKYNQIKGRKKAKKQAKEEKRPKTLKELLAQV